MSNKKRVNRKRRRSPWYNPFAKTEARLSARVTSEEDWQTDVPNIRLSRAFVIVLVMHLVVLGSVVAFTVMNKDEGAPQAENSPVKKQKVAKVEPEKAKKETGSKKMSVQEQDRLDDMRRHIVHSGDSVAKIAAQYGVTSEDIHAVNRIDELYQLYQGRVLRIPVSASKPIDLNPRMAEVEKPTTNGNNFVKSEGPRVRKVAPISVEEPEKIEIKAEPEIAKIDRSLLPKSVESVERPIIVEEAAPKAEPVKRDERTKIVAPRETEMKMPEPERKVAKSSSKTHKVKKGENAFRIAKRFGVNYKELLRHNGITDPSKLQIGQVLRIPN